jgi:hypothetical protein
VIGSCSDYEWAVAHATRGAEGSQGSRSGGDDDAKHYFPEGALSFFHGLPPFKFFTLHSSLFTPD